MRKAWIGLPLALLLAAPVGAPAQGRAVLDAFEGGSLALDLRFESDLLTGAGAAAAASGLAAPVRPDPFALLDNPASLAGIASVHAGATLRPGLAVPSARLPLGNPQGDLEGVEKDLLAGLEQEEEPDYTTLEGTLGIRRSPLASVAIAVPWQGWTFGLAMTHPLALEAEYGLGGLKATALSVQDSTGGEDASLALTASGSGRFELVTTRWTGAVSRKLGETAAAGFSISRTDVAATLSAGYQAQGTLVLGGVPYHFSDPRDPWHNRLAGRMDGSFEGAVWSLGGGFLWRPAGMLGWQLGIAGQLNTSPSLAGELELWVDEYAALELDPDSAEAGFRPATIPDRAEPTRTRTNDYLLQDRVELETPSTVTVSLSRRKGARPSLSATWYPLGRLAWRATLLEKRPGEPEEARRAETYGRGLVPSWMVYGGVHPGWFFAGVGMLFATDYGEGFRDDSFTEIPDGVQVLVPRVDAGIDVELSGRLRFQLLAVAYPEEVLRLGVTYGF